MQDDGWRMGCVTAVRYSFTVYGTGVYRSKRVLQGSTTRKPRRAVVQMVPGGLTNGRAETHPNLGLAGLGPG